MKTKTTFILAISLFFTTLTSPVLAQDATLEETIEWLNMYGLDRELFVHTTQNAHVDIDNLEINVHTFQQRHENENTPGVCGVAWAVKKRNVKGMYMELLNKYCTNLKDISSYEIGKNRYGFYISILSKAHNKKLLIEYALNNEDIVNRVDKAFKHLFKLLGTDQQIKMIDKRNLENKF